MAQQFLLNPDGSIPSGTDAQLLQALGVVFVVPAPAPAAPAGYVVVESEPVEIDGVFHQGWSVVEAPPETPVVPCMKFTHVEFMEKFSDEELKGILSVKKVSVDVELAWTKFELADYINLRDPKTMANVQLLEYAGLIGPGRANQILELEVLP